MARQERELRFEQRMSDFEALMWNIEKDPWLNPNGAMVTILDRPLDFAKLQRRMAYAVAKVPRLRERVTPGIARLSPPTWSTDPEFRLDYHLRHIALAGEGSIRQLFDLATRLYEDPYDRTRPLWQFVVIDGVQGGKGAIFTKMHHAITDGIGAIRLSEMYIEAEREAPLPPEVNLDAVISEALAAEKSESLGPDPGQVARDTVRHLLRRQAGMAQRSLGELALMAADPSRAQEVAEGFADQIASINRQLNPSEDGVQGGSPLWTNRSRHRHLEALKVPLEELKAAGKAMGASVNDMFVAGAANGALAYHAKRDTSVEALNTSFVVSTRNDSAVGGNAFTPTPVQVPGGELSPEERLHEIRDRMAAKRESVSGGGGLAALAGLVNLLPTSVVTQAVRAQATKLDFATSNMRGAPFPTFLSGAEALDTIAMGPVSGTGFNLTTISYNGNLHIGIFVDPKAVGDPADLAACIDEAFTELMAAGGVVRDG